MSNTRFGEDADPPTEFEAQLLAESTSLDDIWVLIGREIGIEALFRVFHKASGEILSVPTRRSFVRRLYIPQRDQEILERRLAKESTRKLAEEFDISVDAIEDAFRRALRTRGRRR